MTLIAAYLIDEQPFLLGDLLITTDPTERPVEIPTMQAFVHSIGEHIIHEPRQKLCVVTPYLAIGWAGDKNQGIAFVDELRAQTKLKRMTWAEVNQYRKKAEQSTSLEVVGWYQAEDGMCCLFNIRGRVVSNTPADALVMAGSGGDEKFLDIFRATVKLQRKFETALGEIDPRFHWMLLAGGLHAQEAYDRHESATIQRGFGGGYECILLSNEGFTKTENFTIAAWEVQIEIEDTYTRYAICGPFHVCKMLYVQDALVMRVFNVHLTDVVTGKQSSLRNDALAIRACFTESHVPFERDYLAVSFNSQAVCCVFYATVNGRLVQPFMAPDIGKYEVGRAELVQFELDGDRVNAILSTELQTYIKHEVEEIVRAWGRPL